jgi:hypothetical protein
VLEQVSLRRIDKRSYHSEGYAKLEMKKKTTAKSETKCLTHQKMQGDTTENIATLNYEPWAKLKFVFELPEKSMTPAEKRVERKRKQSQLTEKQFRET